MATHTISKKQTTTWDINTPNDTWVLADTAPITLTAPMGVAANGVYITGEQSLVKIFGDVNMLGDDTTGIRTNAADTTIKITKSSEITAKFGVWLGANSSNTAVFNAGVIDADAGIAIQDGSAGASITNTGRIIGNTYGIASGNMPSTIHNTGRITADAGIFALGKDCSIYNDGKIIGITGAVLLASDGSTLTNDVDGVLRGQDAVFVQGPSNAADTTITIVNKGVIKGSDDAIEGISATLHITNRSHIFGDITLGDGNDIVNNRRGTISGQIFGGGGDDIITLASASTSYVELMDEGIDKVRIGKDYTLGANVENLDLLGGTAVKGIGNDLGNVITGGKAANRLSGLGGNDTLNGHRGNDRLTGGTGSDTFIFDNGYGSDIVRDFVHDIDLIRLTSMTGIDDFDDLAGKMKQAGDDVVINFGDGDKLTIKNTVLGTLSEDDFLFM